MVFADKKKGSFYIAQYPVRWTAQSVVHLLPSLADLFIPTPTRLQREAFYTSHAAITRNDYITHISTTVYSQILIYTAESTRASMERTKMPSLRNGSKAGFEHGDCESGILPLSYRAPQEAWQHKLHTE